MIFDVAIGIFAGAWLLALGGAFLGCLFEKSFGAATVIALVFIGTLMIL